MVNHFTMNCACADSDDLARVFAAEYFELSVPGIESIAERW